jgi:Mn2+/Fe2+ NRAMP family transporter
MKNERDPVPIFMDGIAAGSGEITFYTRHRSLYGYSFLWSMVAAVVLKWFINREIRRCMVAL